MERLSQLLAIEKDSGSIFLTQKPVPQHVSDDESDSVKERQLVIRATNGTDVKIATRVNADELAPFFERYGEVCRAGMQGLKKRDRKKKDKKRTRAVKPQI